MTTTYLVRGARVLGGERTDLLLADGVVAEIGAGLSADGAEIVDADGLIALPGLVDLHTHLREDPVLQQQVGRLAAQDPGALDQVGGHRFAPSDVPTAGSLPPSRR